MPSRMDGWLAGWMDEWMDGWMDGPAYANGDTKSLNAHLSSPLYFIHGAQAIWVGVLEICASETSD